MLHAKQVNNEVINKIKESYSTNQSMRRESIGNHQNIFKRRNEECHYCTIQENDVSFFHS